MPRVDFYVLSAAEPDGRVRQACRLAEQAAGQGQRVFIQTASASDAQRLDELLWTFNDRSFLPHEIAGPVTPTHPRILVLLGHEAAPAQHRDLVINLTENLPGDFAVLSQVAEIVDTDNEHKRSARERFKQYRDQGCTLETHNL